MGSFSRPAVLAAGAAVSLALLTGCSSDDSASSENADACTSFEAAQNEFVGLVQAGPGSADNIDSWTSSKDDAVEAMKSASSTAAGEVQSAMTTFTDALPADTLDLSSADSESGAAYKGNATSVASACEADGTSITLDELPTVTFGS